MSRSRALVMVLVLVILSSMIGCAKIPQASTAPITPTTQPQESTEPTVQLPEFADYDIPKDSILNQIPKFRYGSFVEIRNLDASGEYFLDASMTTTVVAEDDLGGGEMLIFSSIKNEDPFYQYCKELEASGYIKYGENDLSGNLYSTWVSDSVNVTVMYLPNYQRMNVIAEPTRDLPGLESENVYQDLGVENKLVVVSTQFVGSQSGMCMMFQLCDGSFILVDSGFGMGYDKKGAEYAPYWQNNAKEIYHTLEKLAIDRNGDGDKDKDDIVIAAWFLTHPHWDHIGGFMPFSELFADQVTLEQVIVNLPNAEHHTLFIDGCLKEGKNADANGTYVGRIQDAVAQFEGTKFIEAHPGQKYYIRDAVVDMLYTWELERDMLNRMNSASLVFTVELGDTRTLVLGDCGESSSKVLTGLYGDFLKADIQTVAHHGSAGATAKLNTTIDADVAIWPAGEEGYIARKDLDYNLPLQKVKHTYIAGDVITVIPLPFTSDKDVRYWDVVERIYGVN